MNMKRTNFKVDDVELVRFSSQFTSEGGFSYVSGETVITKEEFLACYNAWVLGENFPNCGGDMRGKEE